MTQLPVFSPSRTDAFDRCPLLSYMESVERWVPRQASKKLVGGAAGQAFAVGTAVLHKGLLLEQAQNEALLAFKETLLHYVQHGVTFEASIDEIVQASGVAVSLVNYAKANPFKGWTIIDVEQELPQHGPCRIDVGGYDSDNILAVADVKYKQNLDARYEQNTIDEYLTSWQFLHYPWAYGEYKSEPCYRMYLCLVINKPRFSVRLIPNEVHPETQQIWLQSARAKWNRMSDKDAPLEMSTRHKDQFGLCSFYRACFDYHLDEGLMGVDYVKVPRLQQTKV